MNFPGDRPQKLSLNKKKHAVRTNPYFCVKIWVWIPTTISATMTDKKLKKTMSIRNASALKYANPETCSLHDVIPYKVVIFFTNFSFPHIGHFTLSSIFSSCFSPAKDGWHFLGHNIIDLFLLPY